ncbi:P-loop containing nucleoside triphosphate hydrolase protein [Powellomyces hirtus]|nr:P-loop containing nucleoside triphosphate hydrolase protein [Powellomyces hirtus]
MSSNNKQEHESFELPLHQELAVTDNKNATVFDVPVVAGGEVNAAAAAAQELATTTTKGGKEGDKKKEDEPKVSYGQLFRYATPFDKMLMVLGSIAALAHGTGMPLMTIVFSDIIGSFFAPVVVEEDVNDSARKACIYFVILAVGLFALAYAQMSLWMIAGENQAKRIRELYFKALLRQDIAWFDNVSTGELTTRMIADTTMIQEGISEKVGLILQFVCTFISGFVIAYIKGWRLALVLTGCLPLLVGAAIIMTQALAAGSKSGNTAYAAAGGVAQQVLSGIRTVVAFGGEKRSIDRYSLLLGHAEKKAIKSSIIGGLGIGFIQLIIFSVYSMAFWYGARQIRAGLMTGQEVLNTFFSLIIGAFSLGQAMPSFTSLASAQGAAFKVFNTIDRTSPIDASNPGGQRPAKVNGDIVFKNIDFHYPSRPDVPILKGFSLDVKAGSTVALVGSSGSGKSTIVKLVERFYNPVAGSITLDGIELSDLNVTWLRQQIGIVSQEPTLFDTSIRQNLLYGLRDDASKYSTEELDKMVENACRVANAWEFIQSLPQGVNTSVGESGGMLSGGQKQRIAIARMVMRDPRIVLLDEATSALDTESERLVQGALESASAGRTTIVIAHRLSTIKNADKIVVMSQGEIVETGTHDSLIAEQGVYYGLVEAQRLRGADHSRQGSDEADSIEEPEIVDNTVAAPAFRAPGDAQVTLDLGSDRPPAPQRGESLGRKSSLARKSSVKVATLDRKNSLKVNKITEEEQAEAERAALLKRKVDVMRLVRMNKPEWPIMIFGIICALGTGAVMPAFAYIFSQILTVFGLAEVDPPEMTRRANLWALGFLGLAIAAFLAQFLQIALLRIAGDKLTTRLRVDSFSALVRQEIGYFDEDNNNTGALTGKLAEDATLVQGLTGQTFAQIVSLISNFAVGLGIAFSHSWQLTLVVVACVPLVGAGGYLQLKSLMGAGDKAKKAYRSANQTANEAIESIRTVQTLTQEQAFFNTYVHLIEVPHQVVVRGAFISSVGFASAEASMFLTYAVAFWYGSRLIIWGTYDGSEVMTAMFSIIFSAMAAGQLTNFAPDAAKAKLAALAIFEILDRNPRINSLDTQGQQPLNSQGAPSTDDAHFAYPTRSTVPILRGLDIRANPGETVALVGHSGCGKSTVLGLLERWYDVTKGRAALDAVDVREWNLRFLREQMALVGQEPVLFDVSVRENIAYGAIDGTATQDQIEMAARAANIHDFVSKLPKGYDTLVGEKGGQLSGGQKQRIAIARALIRNPKLLLLDEATSALDSESEKVVQAALDTASAGRTTIVIAHRLSTIQNADRIYVLKAGRVIEQGTHNELVNNTTGVGLYAELVAQQTLGNVRT